MANENVPERIPNESDAFEAWLKQAVGDAAATVRLLPFGRGFVRNAFGAGAAWHAYEASHALREESGRMREALSIAADRLEEDGCDCGTDEPGSCALCVVRAALAPRKEEGK